MTFPVFLFVLSKLGNCPSLHYKYGFVSLYAKWDIWMPLSGSLTLPLQ